MVTCVSCFQKHLFGRSGNLIKSLLRAPTFVVNNARSNHMFKHLASTKEHPEKYEYEVSSDPKEWEFVERLMPLETVPKPKEKPNYTSGWTPPREEALSHPYYVERSKNHMLPVYLKFYNRVNKLTRIKNIHGDLWRFYDELKEYVENKTGKKLASHVNEGGNFIDFKGDFVYYCEQFLLSKGF